MRASAGNGGSAPRARARGCGRVRSGGVARHRWAVVVAVAVGAGAVQDHPQHVAARVVEAVENVDDGPAAHLPRAGHHEDPVDERREDEGVRDRARGRRVHHDPVVARAQRGEQVAHPAPGQEIRRAHGHGRPAGEQAEPGAGDALRRFRGVGPLGEHFGEAGDPTRAHERVKGGPPQVGVDQQDAFLGLGQAEREIQRGQALPLAGQGGGHEQHLALLDLTGMERRAQNPVPLRERLSTRSRPRRAGRARDSGMTPSRGSPRSRTSAGRPTDVSR